MFCRSHRHLLHTHTSLPGTLILPPLFLDTCLIYQSFSSYSRLSRLSPFPEGSGRGWRGAVSQLYCAPGLPLAILEGWPGTRMLTALGCWPQHPGSLWRRFPVFVEVHSPVTFLWGSEHQGLYSRCFPQEGGSAGPGILPVDYKLVCALFLLESWAAGSGYLVMDPPPRTGSPWVRQ